MKENLKDTRSHTWFVQPSEWTELDSDWAERFDSLTEAQNFIDASEDDTALSLWCLRWQNGSTLCLF
jgi:hypothetical protein